MNVLVASPATVRTDILIPPGAAYQERICRFVDDLGQVVDISGWAFTLDVRREYDTEVLLACTEANGRLVVNDTLGSVAISLSALDVAEFEPGRYRYDLRAVRPSPIPVWYPASGYVTFTPQITRP
jgi:hypothetical protein